jgi:hypothetical protein
VIRGLLGLSCALHCDDHAADMLMEQLFGLSMPSFGYVTADRI